MVLILVLPEKLNFLVIGVNYFTCVVESVATESTIGQATVSTDTTAVESTTGVLSFALLPQEANTTINTTAKIVFFILCFLIVFVICWLKDHNPYYKYLMNANIRLLLR